MRVSWRIWAGVGLGVAAVSIVATVKMRAVVLPNRTMADGGVILPNGWKVTPAGRHIPLAGDMPLKMLFLPDGKLAVLTAGWHDHSLTIIDPQSENVVQTVKLGVAWAGLTVQNPGDVYISGGKTGLKHASLGADGVGRAVLFSPEGEPNGAHYYAGLASAPGSVYAVDTNTDTVARYDTSGDPKLAAKTTVHYRPYSVALSPDGRTLAVSNWGDQSLSLLDPDTLKETARVVVGSHPSEMAWGSDGRLFVTNSGSNTVSVIKGTEVVETIRTSINPADPVGSTPDALALSADGTRLYVANADNNNVTVVDVSKPASRIVGFIPTGWYPSALAVSPDGKKIFVGTGKGLQFYPNYPRRTPNALTDYDKRAKYDYIGGVLSGTVSVVDVPDEKQLTAYTSQARANIPAVTEKSPLYDASLVKTLRKIKHVVYVIRENRTYDQVFGDIGKGNSDPDIVLFGENITPNAHKLARDYVLLDNLYCNGEVSEDGHQWCDAAYATDFTERAYVTSYSGRGEPDADDRLTASPAGYLWDNCRKHGVSYLSYGEASSFKSTPDSPPVFTGDKGLEGHASLEWATERKKAGSGRDSQRIQVFIDDLQNAEKTGKWPNCMIMSLGEDHTTGLRAGSFTPQASVASNDIAVGKLVDAVSHSKYWKDTAIFVIEDDAQNGPDHVDAHRTVGLVVSPYVKRGVLDSTLFTTASMVRTIEMILGLPPMSQFDQRATPMMSLFTPKPDFTTYDCLSARTDLEARNPTAGPLASASNKLDWSDYDRADPDKLNHILWAALKPGQPFPAPTRSAALLLDGRAVAER